MYMIHMLILHEYAIGWAKTLWQFIYGNVLDLQTWSSKNENAPENHSSTYTILLNEFWPAIDGQWAVHLVNLLHSCLKAQCVVTIESINFLSLLHEFVVFHENLSIYAGIKMIKGKYCCKVLNGYIFTPYTCMHTHAHLQLHQRTSGISMYIVHSHCYDSRFRAGCSRGELLMTGKKVITGVSYAHCYEFRLIVVEK